jgi:hypothetical protein
VTTRVRLFAKPRELQSLVNCNTSLRDPQGNLTTAFAAHRIVRMSGAMKAPPLDLADVVYPPRQLAPYQQSP